MKTNKIAVGGRTQVFPNRLIYIEGDINYCHLYFSNGKTLTVASTLKLLEGRFSHLSFFRTHKKYLVNLKLIKGYTDRTITMIDDREVLISRRRKNEFLQKCLSHAIV